MPRKIPFLLFRDGRYYARRIVPPQLRRCVGTNELREPLGADRRLAIEKLPTALVKINGKLDHARRALEVQQGAEAARAVARAAPMTASELARVHYNDQLALDEALRDSASTWAAISIDAEALAVPRRRLSYQPATRDNSAHRESKHVTAAAKRWGPWLCAFTGARVTGVLQLRKSDIHSAGDVRFVRITPQGR